jgi:hypothetical protein
MWNKYNMHEEKHNCNNSLKKKKILSQWFPYLRFLLGVVDFKKILNGVIRH